MDRPINQYSREELRDMHSACIIDQCPKCKYYHKHKDVGGTFSKFSNISLCDNCKKKGK